MFRIATAILFMFLASCPALAAPSLDAARVEVYADGLMQQAMADSDTAGGTIAIVQNGRVLVAKGYGTARITPHRVVDADTLFQVASISKTPTYLAVMQLVEAGKVSLDDPVNNHLPPALRIADQGFTQPIRIRHLLTHSAGFDDSALGHIFVNDARRLLPLTRYLQTYRVNRVREPGVQNAYSNYSVSLLGGVIEHVSGMDFATYVETRIFRPLGVKTATYRSTGLPQNRADLLKGSAGNWTNELPEFSTGMPAGSLRASANDMAAYALALAEPVRLEAAGVLRATTFATMLNPGASLSGMPHLGFRPYNLGGGRRGFGHGGSMLSGASDLVIVPELGLGLFVSTNSDGGFSFVDSVVRQVVNEFAPLLATPPVRSEATIAEAKAMAGDWIQNRRNMTTTEAAFVIFNSAFTLTASPNGDLIGTTITGGRITYQPMGGGIWQDSKSLIQIVYKPDAAGNPVIWWGDGSGSAVRARWFERPLVVVGILALTLIGSALACIAAIKRRKIGWADAAAAAWITGIGGFFWMLTSGIADRGAALVFGYPGPMVAFAWIIAAAVGLSFVAIIVTPKLFAKATVSPWRKVRHSALLAAFIVSSLLCWQIGLVGYSGY